MKLFYRLTFSLIGLNLLPGMSQAQTGNVGIRTTTPGSTLTVNGSLAAAYTTVTAGTYTVLATDYSVVWNPGVSGTTAGAFTLPIGTVGAKGRIYFVKNASPVLSLTLSPASASETIDGNTSVVLGPGEMAQLVSTGLAGSGSTYEVVTYGNSAKPWTTTGNAGTSAATNFVGTTDATDVVFKANNVEQLRLASAGNVGIGTATPNSAAILDISAANQGVLFPRVALTGSSTWSLPGTATDGLVVFNTAFVAGPQAVVPGYYYWLTNQWYAFFQTTAALPPGSATFSCSQAAVNIMPNGTSFTNGQSYSGTISIPYTDGNGGSFAADVITQNGVTFWHVPGVLSNGAGNIVYSVTGTYFGSTGSSESISLNLPGGQCAVTVPQVATYTTGTLSCGGAAATGNYVASVPTTSSNTKDISIKPASPGAYSITTNTVNGVSFAATGAFSAGQVGTAQTVNLRATGTPTAAGTQTYTVTAGGQTCTFSVTTTSTATFACGSATKTQSPAGSLVNGTSYTGTYTVPYTAGNGGAYGSTSQIVSGLTLTRVAGTYSASGGNVVYNLSGTYSGTTAAGAVVFPVAECDKVIYGDVLRGSLAIAGCASCAAYDAAAANSWVSVTAAEYTAINNATYVNSSKVGGTDAQMTAASSTYGNYGSTTGGSTAHVTVPASSYLIGFSIKQYTSTTVTGAKIKVGTAVAAGYNMIGSALPSYIATAGGISYFVAKRPSATTPAVATYLGFYSGTGYTGAVVGGSYFQYSDAATLPYSYSYSQQYQAVRAATAQW